MIRSNRAARRGLFLAALLLPALARGAPVPPEALFGSNVHDMPAWELAGIGATGAAAILIELFYNAPDPAHWTGPILFDGAARDALAASTAHGISNAQTASNIGEALAVAYPVVVDAGIVTWLSKGQPDVARRLLYVDAEAFAVTGLLTGFVKRAVGRERPFALGCGTAGQPACTSSANDRNTSFFSGHSSFAFTGAALVCAQHARLDFYDGGDAVVCPVALLVASATGLLRIVADRHWASDVLVGAAVGGTVGTVVSLTHISKEPVPPPAALGSTPAASFTMRF
jgi:membrane-associated phospholipid phosphatase